MESLTGLVAVIAPFAMVVAIIWIMNQRKLEEKRLASQNLFAGETGARQDHRLEQLEERVRVLESIVTDRGFNLANEIEALRSDRPAAAADRSRSPID